MKNIQLDDRGRFTYTFDSEVERFTFFIMNTSGDYLDENCTWNADKNLFEMQPLYPYRKNTGEIRFTINSRIIQYLMGFLYLARELLPADQQYAFIPVFASKGRRNSGRPCPYYSYIISFHFFTLISL